MSVEKVGNSESNGSEGENAWSRLYKGVENVTWEDLSEIGISDVERGKREVEGSGAEEVSENGEEAEEEGIGGVTREEVRNAAYKARMDAIREGGNTGGEGMAEFDANAAGQVYGNLAKYADFLDEGFVPGNEAEGRAAEAFRGAMDHLQKGEVDAAILSMRRGMDALEGNDGDGGDGVDGGGEEDLAEAA